MRNISMRIQRMVFAHTKYSASIIVISIMLFIFPEMIPCSQNAATICNSAAISLLAGLAVAIYTNLKGKTISQLNDAYEKVARFGEDVNKLVQKMDNKEIEFNDATGNYISLINEQVATAEEYEHIEKLLIGPKPGLGDCDQPVVDELVQMIFKSNGEHLTEEIQEEIWLRIRNSLAYMQRQNMLCESMVRGRLVDASRAI